MAPALTEAAGQAQKLKLPYSPTSSIIAKDDSDLDLSPTSLKDCDPDELTNLVQDSLLPCHASEGPLAPYHVSLGLVVHGNGKACPSSSDTRRHCTMNGKTTSKCHNVDSRVVTTGKCTMGLMKTNAGLMMNANSPGTDMAHKIEAEPQQYDTTDSCTTPILQHQLYPPRTNDNILDVIAARERVQANLQRKTERMLRRIYKLQSTQFAQHVSLQLIDFVSYQRKALKLPVKLPRASLLLHHNKLSSSSSSSSSNNGNCINRKSDILQSENVKNLSTAALVNLVRKLESGSNAAASSVKLRKQPQRPANCVQRYGTKAQLGELESFLESSKLDKDACEEIKWTSGNLLTNLQHLEKDIDSDATASSSGGESCDETEVSTTDEKRSKVIPLPIRRRASWRWTVDRAAIISRWTWLQAQVSDLEFRIHQTSEIYRKIRTMKEPVLGEKSNVASAGSSTQMNGYVAGASSRVTATSPETGTTLPEGSCSRTCPLRPLKRRKLLRTVDLPKFNRKAAKLSTVQCGCSPMSRVCNICCGRLNFLQTVDADKLTFNERVSLLDPCFHPVLSFPQDIPLAVHFEALLKSGEPGKPLGKPRSATAVKKKGRGPLNINEHARKQCRKLKKNAAATLTAKLRKKLTKDKRVPGRRRRRDAGHPRIKKSSHSGEQHRQRNISESSGLSSKPESPVPSPGFVENSSSQASGNSSWGSADIREHPKKGGMLHEMMRRRRGESAFDINNIVIPYSMAAATRVERLQYKEILTPKWRHVEDDVDAEQSSITQGALNDQEDVSDEMCARRHDKCEHDEKKRFMGFLHRQHATARRTRSMRSDSRADSSGANTPDPMSPHNMELHESPITTPPSTPAPFVEEASQLSTRRRTTSLSKRDRMLEDLRIPTPDFTIDEIPVLPWDPRTFPLQDQEFEQMLQETADYEHSLAGPPTDIMDTEWNGIPEIPLLVPDPVPSSSLEDTDWNPTVISAEQKSPTRHSIVLKLAKR